MSVTGTQAVTSPSRESQGFCQFLGSLFKYKALMRVIWGRNPASLLCFLSISIPADGIRLVGVDFSPFMNEHNSLAEREL